CLSSVTTALGLGFKPFAEPVFQRCVKLVAKTLVETQMHHQNPQLDMPDKDFMIVALDLLSGLTQGLNTSIESLVASSQPPLLPLLTACMTVRVYAWMFWEGEKRWLWWDIHTQWSVGIHVIDMQPDGILADMYLCFYTLQDDVPEVRQSAYALLGDLAISCFTHITSYLPRFMPELVAQIDPNAEQVSVCNNAAWAAGEIALQWGEWDEEEARESAEVNVWVQPLLERLIPLLTTESTPRTLLENAAITIGRLGFVAPDLVAPHMELFVEQWCRALRSIRDNEEKVSAFRGLCAMIQINPQGVMK
ncbi:armadillo-type protein, partial [Jimgerdemannia flammicorona]